MCLIFPRAEENLHLKFAMSSEEKNNLVATVDQHIERIDNGSWICKICENLQLQDNISNIMLRQSILKDYHYLV